MYYLKVVTRQIDLSIANKSIIKSHHKKSKHCQNDSKNQIHEQINPIHLNTSGHLKSLTLNIYVWQYWVYEQNIMSTIWMANFASITKKGYRYLVENTYFLNSKSFFLRNTFKDLLWNMKEINTWYISLVGISCLSWCLGNSLTGA